MYLACKRATLRGGFGVVFYGDFFAVALVDVYVGCEVGCEVFVGGDCDYGFAQSSGVPLQVVC